MYIIQNFLNNTNASIPASVSKQSQGFKHKTGNGIKMWPAARNYMNSIMYLNCICTLKTFISKCYNMVMDSNIECMLY
jgi:hypothetical protein